MLVSRGPAQLHRVGDYEAGKQLHLLLSKIALVTIDYIEQPGDGRHSHVATLDLSVGGRQLKVAVLDAPHRVSLPDGKPTQAQLAHLTSALAERASTSRAMGDFNFHREAENASIPEGWVELPAVVSLGPTWDLGATPCCLTISFATCTTASARRALAGRARCGSTACWCVAGATCDPGRRDLVDQPVHELARGWPPLPRRARAERGAPHFAVGGVLAPVGPLWDLLRAQALTCLSSHNKTKTTDDSTPSPTSAPPAASCSSGPTCSRSSSSCAPSRH